MEILIRGVKFIVFLACLILMAPMFLHSLQMPDRRLEMPSSNAKSGRHNAKGR